ncbi:hypothetical protein LZ30DRAFT_184254 [Colletotrichum cereale]|nr:hypothetical protein LZ30DRAFT_184254 [Colletotrichum cereale]
MITSPDSVGPTTPPSFSQRSSTSARPSSESRSYGWPLIRLHSRNEGIVSMALALCHALIGRSSKRIRSDNSRSESTARMYAAYATAVAPTYRLDGENQTAVLTSCCRRYMRHQRVADEDACHHDASIRNRSIFGSFKSWSTESSPQSTLMPCV